MKKFIVIALLVVGSTLNAQDIKFGLKAGANLTNITGDDFDVDPRFSFHGGFVAQISFSDLVSLQPEVIYSSQGFTGEDVVGNDVTGKLDYILLPIMVDLNLADGFSVQGGPQLGFNVTDKIEIESVAGSGMLDARKLDVNLNLGLQYILNDSLFLQFRYTYGLVNVREEVKGKNSMTSLSIGYFFF
ncbi:MAG: porin family protein [bacterium]